MSANTGLLSGSCFQHCSIRLYLVGPTGGWWQSSKDCPVTTTHPVQCTLGPRGSVPKPQGRSCVTDTLLWVGPGYDGSAWAQCLVLWSSHAPYGSLCRNASPFKTLMKDELGMNTNTCQAHSVLHLPPSPGALAGLQGPPCGWVLGLCLPVQGAQGSSTYSPLHSHRHMAGAWQTL